MTNTTVFKTPVITPLENLPAPNNPFQHDMSRMGTNVTGAWVAMFSGHGGLKDEYNMSEDELARKAKGELIWYDDPEEIIMVNQKTGQRFKIDFIS